MSEYLQELYEYINEMHASGIDEDAWVDWLIEDCDLTRQDAQQVIQDWKQEEGLQ